MKYRDRRNAGFCIDDDPRRATLYSLITNYFIMTISSLRFATIILTFLVAGFLFSVPAQAATSTAAVDVTLNGEDAVVMPVAMQDTVLVAWGIEGAVKNCRLRTKYRGLEAVIEVVEESGSREVPVFDGPNSLKKVKISCKDTVLKKRINDIAEYTFGDVKQPVSVIKDGETIKTFKNRKSLNAYKQCIEREATACIWGEVDLFGGDVVEPELADLDLVVSGNNPDAFSIELDENDTTEAAVFAFDLDASDSEVPVVVSALTMTGSLSVGTYNEVIDDVTLVIDGEEYPVDLVTDGDSSAFGLSFTLDGVSIDANEIAEAEVVVHFESADTDFESKTITLSVAGSDIVAAASESVLVSGAVTSETHSLTLLSLLFDFVSANALAFANDPADLDDDVGFFTIIVDVAAVGADVFLPKVAVRSSDQGFSFEVENTENNPASTTEFATVLSTTADTEGDFFRIDEAETEEFTLQVLFDPVTSGSYRVLFEGAGFSSTPSDPSQFSSASPATDFRTDFLTI